VDLLSPGRLGPLLPVLSSKRPYQWQSKQTCNWHKPRVVAADVVRLSVVDVVPLTVAAAVQQLVALIAADVAAAALIVAVAALIVADVAVAAAALKIQG